MEIVISVLMLIGLTVWIAVGIASLYLLLDLIPLVRKVSIAVQQNPLFTIPPWEVT